MSVSNEYEYPGEVLVVDQGRETSVPEEKGCEEKPITFAPVAPETGPSRVYGA